MRGDVLIAQALGEYFFVKPSVMNSLTEFLSSGIQIEQNIQNIPNKANNSVILQKITNEKNGKSLAVLAVDGAMYKKDMSGFCMSVASYQKIQEKMSEAKAMYDRNEISKLVFRVTTPGGGVHGLDAMETAIRRLNMPTITFAEDQMCSAGVYGFTATDKLYAAPMTEIGSIGTVVQVVKDKDKEVKTYTSRRAKNKRLNLDKEEDVKKLEEELNVYEDRFYQVVEKNTGFTATQIEKEFNEGGTIMSEKAFEIGFIDGIMVFEDLIEKELNNMGGENTAMPNADSKKLANSNLGVSMEFNQENFNALENENKVLLANRQTMQRREETLKMELENATSALDAKEKEIAALKADMETKLSEAELEKENYKSVVATRLKEASASNVDVNVALAMVDAPSEEEASRLALAAKSNTEALKQGNGEQSEDKKSDILAFCEKNKGSIR